MVSADEVAGRPVAPPRRLCCRPASCTRAMCRRCRPTARPPTGSQPRGRGSPSVSACARLSGPPSHHTRLPRYAQGKPAVIERMHGMHVFADANASSHGEQPQWLYTVVFRGTQLWPDAEPGLTVSIDAWEPYLGSSMNQPAWSPGAGQAAP